MKQLVNTTGSISPDYTIEQNERVIREFLRECNCDGIELIYDGADQATNLLKPHVMGYHLIFYPDWVDFWNGNVKSLKRKFGSEKMWKDFYRGDSRESLLNQFREDLNRAKLLGASYVVFHVSDVSIEEGYTYQWEHTDEDVVNASIEVINSIMGDPSFSFYFLIENLQWPGFSFTKPDLTKRLLSEIEYKKKGIMLDIGHLFCTNLELKSQAEGCEYVKRILDQHGRMVDDIKGVHLHQSVTGSYVKEFLQNSWNKPNENYYEHFRKSYEHIKRIDTHQPFSDAGIWDVIDQIGPEFLVHELAASSLEEKKSLVKVQQHTLGIA